MEEITPYVSSVSKRGQTVVPRQLRQLLMVREGDHLVWEIQGDYVKVAKLDLRKCHQEEELELTEKEWTKLNELIREQDKRGAYTGYSSIRTAKGHLRNLGKHGS